MCCFVSVGNMCWWYRSIKDNFSVKYIFQDILVGSEKGRLWKTTGELHPCHSVRVRRIVWVWTWYNFDGLVKQLSAQFSYLVCFGICVVVEHVTRSFDDSELQAEIVAERTIVASFCHFISFLHFTQTMVQHNDLIACFLKAAFCFTQSETFIKRFDSRRHLEYCYCKTDMILFSILNLFITVWVADIQVISVKQWHREYAIQPIELTLS